MDAVTIGTLLLGMILRLGFPLGITVLLIYVLSKLDFHWQDEARRSGRPELSQAKVHNSGCWVTRSCTVDQKAKCVAFAHQETPCWQVFRQKNGMLLERCIECPVFREAPMPVNP